ncbi:MAG: hypothetical protein MJA31_10010, partial [Clostridia bacterium]|nr:hypothetical protein [Clostridia bacterium]
MKERDVFDEWIKQNLKEEMEEEIPDSQALLASIKSEINNKNKARKRRITWMRAAIIFLAVAVTCAYIATSESYSNYVRRFLNLDVREENEIVSNNSDPGEKKPELIEAAMTPEEIEDKFGYIVHEPEYLPEGYIQQSVTVRAHNQNVLLVYVEYWKNDSEKMLMLVQLPIYNNTSRSEEYNKDNCVVEKLRKNDIEYIVV